MAQTWWDKTQPVKPWILDPSGKYGAEFESWGTDDFGRTHGRITGNSMSSGQYALYQQDMADWNEMKKDLPPNTPKPHDSLLSPSSLCFNYTSSPVRLDNHSQWWKLSKGANWKKPLGPGSSIEGKDNYPVVHISWIDAQA